MLAMNNNNNTSSSDGASEMEESSSPEASSPQQAPLPSGLSALIRAATSQLAHLADVASLQSKLGSGEEDHSGHMPPAMMLSEQRASNFPERLMSLCQNPAHIDVITFLPDGKFFAVRRKAFQDRILRQYFEDMTTFEDFLELVEKWGFSKVSSSDSITVFRHPQFEAGDYERCAGIRYGESPETARVQALPDRARSIVVKSQGSSVAEDSLQVKRRLSPGFLSRRESLSSVSSKQKTVEGEGCSDDKRERKASVGQEEDGACPRSVALSFTSEKLKINHKGDQSDGTTGHNRSHQDDDNDEALVETAVSSATHNIVTDAIETLLRDKGHSKETFLKHEKELSRSSLPGVVPVCKQIFSPDKQKSPDEGSTEMISTVSAPTRTVTTDTLARPEVPEAAAPLQGASAEPTTTVAL